MCGAELNAQQNKQTIKARTKSEPMMTIRQLEKRSQEHPDDMVQLLLWTSVNLMLFPGINLPNQIILFGQNQ